jgi:tetratricopeptide (TPR) repeat protein
VVFALFLLLAADPTFDEAFRAGLLALQRNDLPAAEQNLATASRLAPGNARVWVALARTYWKLDRGPEAGRAADRAGSLGKSDATVLSSLSIFYADAGQPLKAADAQAAYCVLTPGDAAARERAAALYFEAAQPLLEKQRFTDAIAILKPASARLPGSAQLELALGVAYYGMRRFDDATSAFLRTIAIAPEFERPYVFLGKFLGQIPGRMPEVTARFVEYEKAHPQSATGYLLHAKALNVQSADADAARVLLEKALAIDDRDAGAHFEMGVVLDRMERYEDAVKEFVRSAELEPSDAATHYRLSRLYDRLGKRDDARRERELHARLVAAQEAIR